MKDNHSDSTVDLAQGGRLSTAIRLSMGLRTQQEAYRGNRKHRLDSDSWLQRTCARARMEGRRGVIR